MLIRWSTLTTLIVVLTLPGCGPAPVKGEINKTLTSGEPEAIFVVPTISKERTVRVDVTSTATEVDIYVIDGDPEKFLNESHDNRPKKAIASKQKVMADSLEATIPANTEAKVIVYLSDKAAKRDKTEVTGKISSK